MRTQESDHPPSTGLRQRFRWALGAAACAALLWAALAPLQAGTREQPFAFPAAATATAAGARVPAEVLLTLGVRDVLLLQNRDRAPHVFGQLLLPPGGALRLPFEQPGDYPFACDLAPSLKVTVRVLARPAPGWGRLRWRVARLLDAVRTLPVQAPQA